MKPNHLKSGHTTGVQSYYKPGEEREAYINPPSVTH